MSTMPWFRLYSDIIDDRKIARISKRTGQSKALVIGVWVTLLSLASEAEERGVLCIAKDMPYTLEDLEDVTGLPQEILAQLIDEFKLHGMISGIGTLHISNWDKRQFQSDNSTERVQRFRASRETLPKRSRNVIEQNRTDTETDTEEDTEAEQQPRPEIFSLYEQNIGPLTPMIADALILAEKEYPLEWIQEAIQEAVKNNARKWSYVNAILVTWKKDGKGDRRKKPKPEEDRTVYIQGESAAFFEH